MQNDPQRPSAVDVPIGLTMALAQNLPAMERFSAMSDAQKQQLIQSAHTVQTKAQMQALIESLAKPDAFT